MWLRSEEKNSTDTTTTNQHQYGIAAANGGELNQHHIATYQHNNNCIP